MKYHIIRTKQGIRFVDENGLTIITISAIESTLITVVKEELKRLGWTMDGEKYL